MILAHKLLEPGPVVLALRDGLLCLEDRPLPLLKKRLGVNRTRDGMQNSSIRRAKIGGHIATLLLPVIDPE